MNVAERGDLPNSNPISIPSLSRGSFLTLFQTYSIKYLYPLSSQFQITAIHSQILNTTIPLNVSSFFRHNNDNFMILLMLSVVFLGTLLPSISVFVASQLFASLQTYNYCNFNFSSTPDSNPTGTTKLILANWFPTNKFLG